MKKLLLLASACCGSSFLAVSLACLTGLVATPSWGQVVLENWGCDTIVAASNTNPVVLTCNTPHGYSNGATWYTRLWGGTGNWKGVNTQWVTKALGSIFASDTSITVVDASELEAGGTLELGNCNSVPICGTEGTVTSTGVSGDGSPGNLYTIAVTRSSPAILHYASAFTVLPPAASPAVTLNRNRALYYQATAISSTQFSIPVDATAFGALSGTIHPRRTNGSGQLYGADYTGSNNTIGLTSTVSGGSQNSLYPVVTDTSNAKQLLAVRMQTTAGGHADGQASGPIVVSGGGTVATLTLSAPWGHQSEYDNALSPGSLVFLDGWADVRLEDAFAVTGSSGSPPTSFTFVPPAGMTDGSYGFYPGGYVGGFSTGIRGVPNPDFPVADVNQQYTFPLGYAQGYTKSGTWTSSINRYYGWVRFSNFQLQRRSSGGPTGSYGQYSNLRNRNNQPANQQYNSHWYFYLDPNYYDGQWVKMTLNENVEHNVDDGTWWYRNAPTLNGYAGNPSYFGDNSHMWDETGALYITWSPPNSSTTPATGFQGAHTSMGPITLDTVANEPDEAVSTVTATWSPARFTQIHGCQAPGESQPACTGALGGGPGWELSWTAPTFADVDYEVRRSTTSMKTGAGFPAGLCNDGSTTCTTGNGDIFTYTNSVYNITHWASANTGSTYPGDTYLGIRPHYHVNFVGPNTSSPIWIGSHTQMNMQVGDHITVTSTTGISGVTNAAITGIVPATNWWLYDPVGSNVCAMSGTGVSPIAITSCTAHGLTTGDKVRVDALTNGGSLGNPAGNTAAGGYKTATVVDSTHLTLDGTTGNGTYTLIPYATVHGPGNLVQIQSDGSGNCTLTTRAAHNQQVGMTILVGNSVNATLSPAMTGTESLYKIASVPTSTTFTFPCPGVTPSTTFNTEPSFNSAMVVRTDEVVSVAGTVSGTWTSGGTITSTEANKNFTEVFYNPPSSGGGGGSPTSGLGPNVRGGGTRAGGIR